jgi:hypothetical protein
MRRSERGATTMSRMSNWLRQAVAAGALLAALAGCTAPTPWVKPYEREHFADPIMSNNRDPISSTYLDHALETREGAHGATGAVGGGCGCN